MFPRQQYQCFHFFFIFLLSRRKKVGTQYARVPQEGRTRQVQIAVTRSLPFRNTDLVDKAEEWIVLHDAVRNQVWHRFIFAA